MVFGLAVLCILLIVHNIWTDQRITRLESRLNELIRRYESGVITPQKGSFPSYRKS